MQARAAILILLVAAGAIILGGCGGGDTPEIIDGGDSDIIGASGTVQVFLTDAPASYLEEVWVNILRVELVPGDGGPIVVLDSGQLPGKFELLDLVGQPVELGVIEAPVGTYQQIRLVLDADGHSIVLAGGADHDLRVPSGEQTGVKVNLRDDALVVDEGEIALLLDFLAAPSVHRAGESGQWIMRPVIHGSVHDSPEFAFGSLSGIVQLEDGTIPQSRDGNPPAVFAVGERSTSVAEIDPETGTFELPALLEGEYELLIGWLTDDGEMAAGEVMIVIEDGTPRQILVTVEASSTHSLELDVRPGMPEDLPPGPPSDGDVSPSPPAHGNMPPEPPGF